MKAIAGIFGETCGCTVFLYDDGSIKATGHQRAESNVEEAKAVSLTLERLMAKAIEARAEMGLGKP